MELKVIARIINGFSEKFGVPRQSGLADNMSKIVFEPEYRDVNALKGIEEYSYIWLIWGFSETPKEKWRPMVRPPRLGGNKKMGIFATRSPFRPNPIGLSSVSIEKIEKTQSDGVVLWVKGADLMDGTPIYDIKPYLPFVDSHLDAKGGFAEKCKIHTLKIEWNIQTIDKVTEGKKKELEQILAQDPRPSYQNDPNRVYGMCYDDMDIRFRVEDDVLYVLDIKESDRL